MSRPQYQVGDTVFDMPSQADRKILEVDLQKEEGRTETYYRVDAPDNPTGDGAFPDGWRNEYEVGPAGIPMKLEY